MCTLPGMTGFLLGCAGIAAAAAIDLQSYGALLGRYAPAGKVQYAELKANDWPRLEALYRGLAAEKPGDYATPDAELAFWINAYNIIVLHEVTRAYPVQDVWAADRQFFKAVHQVAGQAMSLDDIEHQRIRARFSDPRTHFGVNCAAMSCPLLASAPYTAENVQAKLEANTRVFINDEANVRFDPAGVLWVSELFRWYSGDFTRAAGSVEGYLRRYLSPEKRALLDSRKWTVQYIPYDWSLNATSLR